MGATAYHIAALEGQTEVINYFLRNGIVKDINLVTEIEKNSALIYAADSGRTDAAALLLEKGADASLCNASGKSPLVLAAAFDHLGVVKVILQHRPNLINYPDSWSGFTALLCACQGGYTELVTYLLEKGADPAYTTSEGVSAATVALANGHVHIATILAKTSSMKSEFAPVAT